MRLNTRVLLGLLIVVSLSSCKSKPKDEDDSGPAPTSGYQVQQVTTGGTIEGSVTLSSPATVGVIAIQKDEDACGTSHPNPSAPGASTVVPGAIVYLEHVTSGKAFLTPAAQPSLAQKNCDYVPHVQIVKQGATLLLSNDDKALHNSNFKMGEVSEFNEAQPEGAPPREVTLKKAGLYTVNCDVHPWMRGFVMVVDHPYYAITDASGKFSLSDVPAGKYTIKLWRDNWQLDQPKDPQGRITGYTWASDFDKNADVTVTAGRTSTINFTLP